MNQWLGPSSAKNLQTGGLKLIQHHICFSLGPLNVKTMDIIYMRTKNGYTNDSDFIHSNFIAQNPEISIPYLIMMAIITLSGCIGNALVIGSVATYKVHSFKL